MVSPKNEKKVLSMVSVENFASQCSSQKSKAKLSTTKKNKIQPIEK